MARAEVVRNYGGISAEQRRARRRRQVLDAGRQIWGAQGAAEVTVRGVCAAAGLTPRYFYEQFENRDALLLAIDAEVRDELIGALVPASVAEPGDIGQKFKAALLVFFEKIAADPQVHRILTSDATAIVGLARQRNEAAQRVTRLIVETATTLLDPAPAPEDLERVARFVVGGVNALIEAWLREPAESPAELAEICTRLCLSAAGL